MNKVFIRVWIIEMYNTIFNNWRTFLILGASKTFGKSTWLHWFTKYTREQILFNDASRKWRRKNIKLIKKILALLSSKWRIIIAIIRMKYFLNFGSAHDNNINYKTCDFPNYQRLCDTNHLLQVQRLFT